MRLDRDRRRSEPSGTTYEHIHDPRSPARLARDLLQVIQETVFSRKFEETPKRCPLVREESDLTSSDEEDGIERRIANLIDFFFTIVKSQKDERKSSGGSCFKSECSPTDVKIQPYMPTKVNTELEQKMETLIEFLATTGCMDKEEQNSDKEDKKITLMEFLFGPDDGKSWPEKPLIEINSEPNRGLSLSESNIHFKDLTFIDETPEEESNETLVEILLKYMENYSSKDKLKEPTKSISMTPPSLSEKSKSDITISRLETYSDMSKTKSDSTLTQTQDTVIDRYEDKSWGSRRISETVVDLSYVKQDLEGIFEEAAVKVREYNVDCIDDIMSEQEDVANFNAYTKPPSLQYYTEYLPYSVELSDIMEEDEPSSRGLEKKSSENERMSFIRFCAEEVIKYIEEKIQSYPFEKDGDDSSEEYSREFDVSPSLKRSSISLIDLRNIPDLPPSMMVKPQVVRVDKSTSTTEISDSLSDMSKRIDSACMTEDTTLTSSSERNERAIDKLESLHRFFSKSRLEIIDESLEEHADKKSPKEAAPTSESTSDNIDQKVGQASLDDVDDLQDDNDLEKKGDDSGWDEFVAEMDEKCTTEDIGCKTVDFPKSGEKAADLNKTQPIVMSEENIDYENTCTIQHRDDSKTEDGSLANR